MIIDEDTMLGQLIKKMVGLSPECWGTLWDLMERLSGSDGPKWLRTLRMYLRGELMAPCRWREQNGIIYFWVKSNGMTGEQWITYLEAKGVNLSVYAKVVLRSSKFKPTNGTTTRIAVLRGMLFSQKSRIPKKIRSFADGLNFTEPNAEVACLIRDMFSDQELEDMDLLRVVVFHKPINDSVGPGLLGACRSVDGPWLGTSYNLPRYWWDRRNGFAFVESNQLGF